LRRALEKSGEASLVVSGGITPQECFLNLSRQVLDWSSVTIVPSDERWVEAHNLSSNEHLIHTRLMLGPASAARLLSFYLEELEAEEAPEVITNGLNRLGRLDPDNGDQCVVVKTAGSPYLRISLTLPALLDSHAIVLLFFGEAKRRVFEAAAAGDSTYPVAALLSQDKVPVTVIWAP
jgi:6-phosphogluconolactonase